MSQILIDVPFAYDATYVPPRGRTERKVTVIDSLPLQVRQLDDRQFPVAARFADTLQAMRWKTVDDLRWDGRNFHRPYICEWSDRRFHVPAEEFLENLKGHAGEQPFRELQRVPDPQWHNQDIFTRTQVTAGGRVISDNRRERVGLLVEKAAGVVLCGDKIFQACGEPAWRVVPSGFIRAEAVLVNAKTLATIPGQLVRADRLKEYATQFWNGNTIDTSGNITVILPQALRLSPEAGHLLDACSHAVTRMSARLGSATRAEFDTYASLRDALTSADGVVGEPLVDAARAAIDDTSPLLPANEREDLRKAFERWRLDLVRDDTPLPEDLGGGLDLGAP